MSYQSSGVLARQIEYGAPAAVFISAHKAWIERLVTGRLLRSRDIRVLAHNRLVLITNRESGLAIKLTLLEALTGHLGRFPLAIGDPGHVPAGQYAKAALSRLGLWDRLRRRSARANNVREALAFVERGATPLGIVYASDARASARVRVVAAFPPGSHPPIVYRAGLLAHTAGTVGASARAFFAHLLSRESASILVRHGFRAPSG